MNLRLWIKVLNVFDKFLSEILFMFHDSMIMRMEIQFLDKDYPRPDRELSAEEKETVYSKLFVILDWLTQFLKRGVNKDVFNSSEVRPISIPCVCFNPFLDLDSISWSIR